MELFPPVSTKFIEMESQTGVTQSEYPDEQQIHLRRDAEENRKKILQSARKLFADRGLSVTLDDIAKDCHVGVGTVYRRFANKECLVEALFESVFKEIVSIAEHSLEIENSWDGFTFLLGGLLKLESEDKGLRQVVLGSGFGGERILQEKAKIIPLIRESVERAQHDGYLRSDFRPQDVPVIVAMIGNSEEFCRKVAPGIWERYFTFLLDGLTNSRSRTSPLPIDALDDNEMTEAMRSLQISVRNLPIRESGLSANI